MKNIFKYLRTLPLRTHRIISFASMLAASVLGLVFSQFSSIGNLGMNLCFLTLIGGIAWHIVFVRCPHCGHHFNPRTGISNFCPDCGGKLE